MIQLLYPEGCYGHYFRRCIYTYTNLLDHYPLGITFDEYGSSHDNEKTDHKIKLSHYDNFNYENIDNPVITIFPTKNHYLDYYNNQLAKYFKLDIVSYLQHFTNGNSLLLLLNDRWGYSIIDKNLPIWVIREFISYWIDISLNEAFSLEKYNKIPFAVSITTEELFDNLIEILNKICSTFELSITADESTILSTHSNFKRLQIYHLSQVRCINWANTILHSTDNSISSCKTIIDEAYVQHLLREQGFEIRCNELDNFPKTSNEIRKIMYKI